MDFDEQLDDIICSHKVKKSKEKRLLRKKELKTQNNTEKINLLKYHKLVKKSNQTLALQIFRLFHEDNFCDLIIECDHLFFKYLHSCIFLARVPALYKLLKEQFIVGKDTSLVPVFKSSSPTSLSNPLYDNYLNNSNCLNSAAIGEQEAKIVDPYFTHIRLPSELLKVFDLIGFLQNIYSQDNLEDKELELILILNKIKILQNQNRFNLENLLNLDFNIQNQPMSETCLLNEAKEELDDCKKMKVRKAGDNKEPLYINLEDEKLVRNKTKFESKESLKDQEANQPQQNIKKDKTFLLSKVNIENEQFEINLLNDDNYITNKLVNIDNEIKEIQNQINSPILIDQLSVDPENEEQQLITALSNEKIEVNGLVRDDLIYGNIKSNQKDYTDKDTISDLSEICDEFSADSSAFDAAAANNETGLVNKFSDSLEIRNIDEIELNFDKNQNQDNKIMNDRNSLFYEMINIENKVQKVITSDQQKEEHQEENEKNFDEDLEEDKTLSGSMVRSGTFNLQSQYQESNQLKADFIQNKLSESEEDSSSLSKKIEQDSLMSNSNVKTKSTKINKNLNKKQSEKHCKKSLQYFLDETQIIKQQEVDEMQKSLTTKPSGLFFIDLEDSRLNTSMSKSRTFDRKKNKLNQKSAFTSESNESSLNSSFTQQQNDLLPMGLIIRKENLNEKINHSFKTDEHGDGMFRLGNFRTLSGTNITNYNSKERNNSASTLRSFLKKTKSEVNPNTANSNPQKQKQEDSETIAKNILFSCSRLGEDLLKLFLNQINCDFNLFVSDKSQKIGAHKCILMARSEYFSKKIFNNLECNQINLVDFSYDSVHFVLCHLYSGTINIPNFNNEKRIIVNDDLNSSIEKEYNDLNLAELLSLSDLFQLSILKDAILFEIKKNYCHHFHKPCNECIPGVINSLILAQKCELPSLYTPCINWISRHYRKIWSTKQFATLFTQQPLIQQTPTKNSSKIKNQQPIRKNNDIISSIYNNVLDSLTNENVIDKILNLHQLANSMPRMKWNEIIISLIEELIEDCCKYLAANYNQIVSSQKFIELGFDKSWQIEILENYLCMAVDLMKCETACKTFIHLENIVIMGESENILNNPRRIKDENHIYANMSKNQFSDEFIRTVQKVNKCIERYLIHNANEAVYCASWNELSANTQDYIKNSAVLVFEFEKPLAKRPVLSSMKFRQSSASTDKKNSENSVKRKNSQQLKKSTNEDRLSDQSRQSTLTRQSASRSADQKNSKFKENIENSNNDRKKDYCIENNHIYDEVPLDLKNELKERKECLVEYSKAIKNFQPQIAKVQPFSALPSDLSMSNITTSIISANYEEIEEENNYENIIYDESINSLQKVDSESSLASSCLQEAENLEQELTRKIQNQRIGALRQCKMQQQPVNKHQSQNSSNNIGSPQLRTSLRIRNRQQQPQSTANSISSNSISSASSNRTQKTSRSSNKKPPFK